MCLSTGGLAFYSTFGLFWLYRCLWLTRKYHPAIKLLKITEARQELYMENMHILDRNFFHLSGKSPSSHGLSPKATLVPIYKGMTDWLRRTCYGSFGKRFSRTVKSKKYCCWVVTFGRDSRILNWNQLRFSTDWWLVVKYNIRQQQTVQWRLMCVCLCVCTHVSVDLLFNHHLWKPPVLELVEQGVSNSISSWATVAFSQHQPVFSWMYCSATVNISGENHRWK